MELQTHQTMAQRRKVSPMFTGHESLLNHFMRNGKFVHLELLNGKDEAGYIRAFDNYTISLEMPDTDGAPSGDVRVYFKHALQGFYSADK